MLLSSSQSLGGFAPLLVGPSLVLSQLLATPSQATQKVNVHTAFCPWLCDSYFYGPAFPTNLLVATRQPSLTTALLKELNHKLPTSSSTTPTASVVCAARGTLSIDLALKGGDALFYHGFELIVVDIRKRKVEELPSLRDQRWEEPMKEYRM
jgi:hypothetical protein